MNILKKKIGGFTMGELIAVVLALIIVHGIPYYLDQKESKRKSEEISLERFCVEEKHNKNIIE